MMAISGTLLNGLAIARRAAGEAPGPGAGLFEKIAALPSLVLQREMVQPGATDRYYEATGWSMNQPEK